jgi:hypothetical protein
VAKTHYGTTPRGGYVTVYLTERETRAVADDASRLGAIIGSAVPEPTVKTAILATAFALRWKARRCLSRGKCLAVTVAGLIAIPAEYTPGVDDIPPEPSGLYS